MNDSTTWAQALQTLLIYVGASTILYAAIIGTICAFGPLSVRAERKRRLAVTAAFDEARADADDAQARHDEAARRRQALASEAV